MAAKPLAVLWQVLFRALYPAWAGDPLPPRLIRDVLGGHPIRSDVQGWAALRELWSDTLAGVSISAQPAAHRETPKPRPHPRSEEHTSELQSLMRISYAVFCLKKKHK